MALYVSIAICNDFTNAYHPPKHKFFLPNFSYCYFGFFTWVRLIPDYWPIKQNQLDIRKAGKKCKQCCLKCNLHFTILYYL